MLLETEVAGVQLAGSRGNKHIIVNVPVSTTRMVVFGRGGIWSLITVY